MQDNATLAMKPFVTEMLADLDNRDEADREQIKAIQHRIRERGVVRSISDVSMCQALWTRARWTRHWTGAQ